eukprot:7400-Heterococcus_DN1.PRE.1
MSAQQSADSADSARAAATAVFAALNPSNPSCLPTSLFPALMRSLGMQSSVQESFIVATALSELPLERFVAWYETQLQQLRANRSVRSPSAPSGITSQARSMANASVTPVAAGSGADVDDHGSTDGAVPTQAARVNGGTTPAVATEHTAPRAADASNAAPAQQDTDVTAPVDAASASASSSESAGSPASRRFQLSMDLSAPNLSDRVGTAVYRREQRGLLAAAWLAAYDELLTVPTAFLVAESNTTVEAACVDLAMLQTGTIKYSSANHVQACMAITTERVRRLKRASVTWSEANLSAEERERHTAL